MITYDNGEDKVARYQISDAGDLRKYYFQIPNMVDDSDISVHAYRLYGHLKRVAGDAGKCYQSTRTLAKACHMSTATISRAKQELLERKLITISFQKSEHGGMDTHCIRIEDIWAENIASYSQKQHVSTSNLQVLPQKLASYSGSIKEEPFKKNPLRKTQYINTDDDLDNFEEEEELSDNSHELSPAIAEQKILFSLGEKKNGNDAKLNAQQITQTPSPKSSELSPTTTGGILLFAKLSNEAHAKGRKSPKSFASIAQRDAFLEVEERLTINQLEQAIDNALRNEITARRNIINYLSKYKARSVHAPALGYKHTTIVNEDGSVYF